MLLRGSRSHWKTLKDGFKVSTNFRQEISQNRNLLKWLQEGEKFKGATIPYLAHTFRALKNLAIFSLAQKRNYVFDKHTALRKAFPQLDREAITLLINANDIFERSSKRRSSTNPVDGDAIRWVRTQIAHAMGSPQLHATR